MSERRWKRNEREIAAILGGQRVPVSGRSRGDAPDIAHSSLSIEVKSRQSLPAWLLEAMFQTTLAARSEQLPIAVLHVIGTFHADDLVVMTLDDFRRIPLGGIPTAIPTNEG